jgi:quercetin dioxygenase-like cupin family protein
VIPAHTHPHEQIGYLISGHVIFHIDGEKYDTRPGDSWCIPGGVEHMVDILEDSLVIEVFSPVRDEYI